MKRTLVLVVSGGSLLLPVVAFAQTPDTSYITGLIESVSTIITYLLPLLMALTVLFIFYGLAKMAFAAGNEEARKEGRQYAIWGVIALVVMVGLYALVGIVQRLFGLETGVTPTPPSLPTRS